MNWIYKKWIRKGWYGQIWDLSQIKALNRFTDKFYKIRLSTKEAVDNIHRYLRKFDGRVVVITFKKYNVPQSVGIIEDQGDNGWYFYTKKSCRYDIPIWIQGDEIAYIELHPYPKNIWRRLNYLFWKFHKIEDRFHKKITESYNCGTICDYSQANLGIFTYSNPYGKIGDCFSSCQCKNL